MRSWLRETMSRTQAEGQGQMGIEEVGWEICALACPSVHPSDTWLPKARKASVPVLGTGLVPADGHARIPETALRVGWAALPELRQPCSDRFVLWASDLTSWHLPFLLAAVGTLVAPSRGGGGE